MNNLENEYPEEVQKYARTFFEYPDFLEFIVEEIIDEQIKHRTLKKK